MLHQLLKEREKALKPTRMKRHEQKIRATNRRNKRIFAVTTMVGLVCPATLGTIQALADETTPTTEQVEQTEQPVAEPVTPVQPTDAPSQTPAPVQTEPVQPEAPVTTPVVESPVSAETPVTNKPVAEPQISVQADLSAELAQWNNFFAQIIPLLDELESKVVGTSYKASYDALNNRFDFASFTGGQFPENSRDQAFYDQWLPELASILSGLQQLKADISSEPTVSVTGVTLSSIPEMEEGGTYQLTATITPDNATNKNVTWSSSDGTVATVDANGLVTAIAEGTFTITVTTVDGGFTASTDGIVKADDGKPMKDFDYTAVLAAIARYDAMVKDEYTPESWTAMEAEMINNDEKLHLIDYLRKLPNAEGTVPPGYENQFQTDLNAYAAKAQSIMDMAIKKDVTQTGLFYDLVGDTSAKVGETKTYTYNEVKFFSDGSMTQTTVNIGDTSYPLTSSNPSDVIVGGSITFGSEGTRTLVAKDNAGASLTVTVTKDSQEKTLTDIGFIPVIGMGVDGKLVPWSDFRVNLYYSDNTEEAVIPNATDYTFTTNNPNDVITADGIIFNGVGNRVITVTHKGFTDKNGFVVVADQGLKEEDLKEAIKNGEDKISQGGWETTKDLEDAIQKGKDVLADENRTQEDIDNATKQINDAINALTKKDDGNNGGNGSNGDGNGNNQDGNNGANNGNNGDNKGNTGNNSSNKTSITNVTNKSNQASNNSSNKDNLPQTGDNISSSAILAGLTLAGFSTIGILKRRRKA